MAPAKLTAHIFSELAPRKRKSVSETVSNCLKLSHELSHETVMRHSLASDISARQYKDVFGDRIYRAGSTRMFLAVRCIRLAVQKCFWQSDSSGQGRLANDSGSQPRAAQESHRFSPSRCAPLVGLQRLVGW